MTDHLKTQAGDPDTVAIVKVMEDGDTFAWAGYNSDMLSLQFHNGFESVEAALASIAGKFPDYELENVDVPK